MYDNYLNADIHNIMTQTYSNNVFTLSEIPEIKSVKLAHTIHALIIMFLNYFIVRVYSLTIVLL